MSAVSEEAKCFETVGRDCFVKLSRRFDLSLPFPSYAKEASALLGVEEAGLVAKWEAVNEAFEEVAGKVEVIGRESKLFPQGYDGFFLYLSGDSSLLCYPRVTTAGALQPSVQAKSDMLSFLSALVRNDAALLAPVDRGLCSYALSVMLKLGGRAIGISSEAAGKEPGEGQRELSRELEEKGLVVSIYAPSSDAPLWTLKLRNQFIASASSSVFLPEERDGGPGWAVADPVLEKGGKVMLSKAAVDNPVFGWMRDRAGKGALLFSKEKDARKLLPRHRGVDTSPDLFS